jgi:hypothetical protein
MRDLVMMINCHRTQEKKIPAFSTLLKKVLLGKIEATTFSYCKECRIVLKNEQPCKSLHCQTQGKRKGKFFVFSLAEQLKDIMEGNHPDAFGYWCSQEKRPGGVHERKAFNRLNRLFPDKLKPEKWWNNTVTMYADGAPITESSKQVIWPVMFKSNNMIPELADKPSNTIFSALWVDSQEPYFPTFLLPIVEELASLSRKPIKVTIGDQSRDVFVYLLMVCGDAPAKAKMLGLYNFNKLLGGCNWDFILTSWAQLATFRTSTSKDL